MASEYLKKKYADVKPDEPVVLTKKQKLQNWWYYHKVIVLIAAVLLVVAGYLLVDMLSQVKPDYNVAIVSDYVVPDTTAQEIEAHLEALGQDLNGDGKVHIDLYRYTDNPNHGNALAEKTRLMADLSMGTLQVFLLGDPTAFQEQYGVLLQQDGTAFEEGEDPASCLSYGWEQCPKLRDLELIEKFSVAVAYAEKDNSLWQAMTAGVEE